MLMLSPMNALPNTVPGFVTDADKLPRTWNSVSL